jgi:dihydrofolate reductase
LACTGRSGIRWNKQPCRLFLAEIEFAKAFDSVEKVVFSKSLGKVEDKNSRLVRTNPEEEILRLKQQPGKDILVDGAALPSYLIEHGRVDEYIFVVYPINGF